MSFTSTAYNAACTIGSVLSHPVVQTAASVAFGFYGGPIAAIAARSAFPMVYATSFGSVPTMTSIAYWAAYAPAREHFVSQAFTWGPRAAVAAAPLVSTGVKYLVNSLWGNQTIKAEEVATIQASETARIAPAV